MAVSFTLFPKPLSVKYVAGGLLVTVALYWLQRSGKRAAGAPSDAIDGAVPADGPISINADMNPGGGISGTARNTQGGKDEERP